MTDQMLQSTSLPFDRVRTPLDQADTGDPDGREELEHSLSTLPSDHVAQLHTDPALPVAVDRIGGPDARDAGLWIPVAAFSLMVLIIVIFLILAWRAAP